MLTLRQEARRRRNIAAAIEEFQQLRARLAGSKTRLRGAAEIDLQIKVMLEKHHVARYLKVRRTVREEHEYRQTQRGRPGPDTAYRKITRRRFDIEWTTDEQTIAYDHNSDGMYPLVTNDRGLSPAQVLEAHKGQPMIEKRFEQVKTVHEIAPVFLKDEGRIEAFFTLYFLALLVQALIETRAASCHEAREYRRTASLSRAASVRTPHDRTDPAPVQPRRTSPADRWCTHCAGLRRSPHGIAASAAQATRRPGRRLSPAGLATKFAPNWVPDVRNVRLEACTTCRQRNHLF